MSNGTPEEILAQLQPVFQQALDTPGLKVTMASNATNTEGWDSLAHIDIIESVEQRFKVQFALGELQDLKVVGDLVALILKKRGAVDPISHRNPGSSCGG
jgi:acyl carrier protein